MPFFFTCCQGELFLHFPGLGLTHVPTHWLELVEGLSIMLPGYLAGWTALSLLCYAFLRRITQFFLKSNDSTKNSFKFYIIHSSLPLWSLLVAYRCLSHVLLPGEVGRQISMLALPPYRNYYYRYEEPTARLKEWETKPQSSPLGNITASGGPEGSLDVFFSKERADEIYQRILALKDTHWVYSAPLARGSGLFLLGRKYNGAKRAGQYLTLEEQTDLGQEMWQYFGDVMEELRQGTERLVKREARLYRESWPPTFIMHAGSALSVHPEIMNVHLDAIVLQEFQDKHHQDTNLTCQWQNQLTLLVSIHLPPHGAHFEHYDSRGKRTKVPHVLGQGLVCECQRPHNLGPFHPLDADSADLRVVLHAFLVPCRAEEDSDVHYQVIGPLGFGTPYSSLQTSLEMTA